MRIAIAADHNGVALKARLVDRLRAPGPRGRRPRHPTGAEVATTPRCARTSAGRCVRPADRGRGRRRQRHGRGDRLQQGPRHPGRPVPRRFPPRRPGQQRRERAGPRRQGRRRRAGGGASTSAGDPVHRRGAPAPARPDRRAGARRAAAGRWEAQRPRPGEELQDPRRGRLRGLLDHRHVPVLAPAAGTPAGTAPPTARATRPGPGTTSAGTSSGSRSSGSTPGTVSRSNISRAMPSTMTSYRPGSSAAYARGEVRVAAQHAVPRPHPGVGGEARRRPRDQVDHPGQPVLAHEREVLGEARVLLEPVLHPAGRGVQHHAEHPVRVRHRDAGARRAADAAAHQVGALDAEVVEQADGLGDVVRPGDPLHPPTGPAGLAPVEGDAGVAPARAAPAGRGGGRRRRSASSPASSRTRRARTSAAAGRPRSTS